VTRLREIRLERAQTAPGAFTLAAIASRLGVTESAVSRWERGINTPTKRHQRALARVLGVTVEELLAPVAEKTAAVADLDDLVARRRAERLEAIMQSSGESAPVQAPPSPARQSGRGMGP